MTGTTQAEIDSSADALRSTVAEDLMSENPTTSRVFAEVLRQGPIARIDVANRTGLSQAAVTKAVSRLMTHELIATHDSTPSVSRGRPVQPISVQEDALLAIGITVRVNEIFGVVTTLRAHVVHVVHRPLASIAVADVAETVAEMVQTLSDRLGDDASRLIGAGIAVSGDVDKQRGIVRDSPRLNWSNVDLGAILGSRFSFPVVIENDVRALSIAEEWFGIGVDTNSFAIVTIGAGIGCGLYLNGDVVEGAQGVAGELGHLPLAYEDVVCSCGRRGCVETVASSSAILQAVRTSTGDPLLTMREAVELARGGNPDAIRIFERAGSVIGLALATLANLVGPAVILLAGESVTNYDLFERRVRETFDAHAFGAAAECRIVTRAHTFEDWARGSAASVIRSMADGSLRSAR
ncbi:ROK family protein [Plantibacter sp. YIM 135347]|uniref:ROK family protein n=1 Tax=Plantibacter sp. YIM 135347 TaxID=3423919 RepID=UPI003D346C1E